MTDTGHSYEVDATDEQLAMALFFAHVFPEGRDSVKPSTVWFHAKGKRRWYRMARIVRAALRAAGENTRTTDDRDVLAASIRGVFDD